MKLVLTLEYDYVAVVLDPGTKNFRHEIFPLYKANRNQPDDDLVKQLIMISDAINALNLPCVRIDGFEADDVIATFVSFAKKIGANSQIISGDKDLMQLVDDDVLVFEPLKGKNFNQEAVNEKFGVYPNKLVDYLSIIGDASDNIPGIKGAGPKTAIKLLEQFGSFEKILENPEQITQKKIQEYVKQNIELLKIGKELIQLRNDAPILADIELYKKKLPDPQILINFLDEKGFKSTIDRARKIFFNNQEIKIEKSTKIEEYKHKIEYIKLNDNNFESEFELIELNGICSIEFKNKIIYIFSPLGKIKNPKKLDGFLYYFNIDEDNTDYLKLILENQSLKKIFANSKKTLRDILFNKIQNSALNLNAIDDLSLMFYSIYSTKYQINLENISGVYDIKSNYNRNINNESDVEKFGSHLYFIYKLYIAIYRDLLEKNCLHIYNDIDIKITKILLEMEISGVKFDQHILQNLSQDYRIKLQLLEGEIYKIAGTEFNIGSPKQLNEIFDKMGIELTQKGKSGMSSTNSSILEDLSESGEEIAEKIINWRHFNKLINTYLEVLPTKIDNNTGRIHTHFDAISVPTGRIISKDPNLQNIPIKKDDGYKIRSALIAEDGNLLIVGDYSQIELRILADIANVQDLKNALISGADIHKITASQIFNIPIEKINSSERNRAKAINFGIIYGISAFGLANNLKIPRGEATEYIENYFKKYPEIKIYMDKMSKFGNQNGYVQNIFDRKIFVEPSKNNSVNRAAINAPIQSTAADILKKSMIKLQNYFLKNNLPAKIILQIHDELIVEAKEQYADQILIEMRKIMMESTKISVPLIVNISKGKNWLEAK